MPYQMEHAARIIDPSKFKQDSFRRKEITKGISIIIGKLEDEDTTTTQAYRFNKDEYTMEQAKTWLKDNNIDYISFEPAMEKEKEMTEELEVVNLKKEILTVGKFNGIDISENDINEMIDSFNNLKDIKEVSMRIGHSSDDKPNTKVLRAGTVESLEKTINKKTGKITLLANLRNVPKQIYEYIEKEILKPVSIEFLKKWKDGITGKEYKNVLTAIALMGTAQPAVPALSDFEISFNENEKDILKIEYKEEESIMEVKELQEQKQALEVELQAKENERLQLMEEKKQAELKLKEFQEQISNKEIVEFIERNSNEKSMKILPCEKERISRILQKLDNETICFQEGEEKLTARQEFQLFIEGLNNRIDFDVKSQKMKIEKPVEFKSELDRSNYLAKLIDEKLVEFAAKGQNKDYAEVMNIVLEENKELLK